MVAAQAVQISSEQDLTRMTEYMAQARRMNKIFWLKDILPDFGDKYSDIPDVGK
jgi:hypothetical protein